MKSPKPITFLLALSLTLTYCTQPQNKTTTESPNVSVNLEGSWDLQAYVPNGPDRENWRKYGDSILYQKHLTSDQFAWFRYDVKNEKLLGMGGGYYSVNSGQYVEDIKYFYPPGSSELGQAIPFDYEVKDNTWYHSGYAKILDMDSESGNIVVVDSVKIEEKWLRTKLPVNTDLTLSGSWELEEYLDYNQNDFVEYPAYMDYIKLITPTHFAWVYYNNEGDEIYAAGSGPYLFKDSIYSETIDLIHPNNTGQIGETITFETSLSEERWKHAGYIPNISIDSSNGTLVRDSIRINENWVKHIN